MLLLLPTVLLVWLGTMFIYTAGLKLVYYDQANRLIHPYGILPRRISTLIGYLLPWTELLAGILLLSGVFFPVGPLIGLILGVSFAYAAARVLRQGAEVPCGCIGMTGDRVDFTTLARALFIPEYDH